MRTIRGETCSLGDAVYDLVCTRCGSVRYVGSVCQHVPVPAVVLRKWDNHPLCTDCLSGARLATRFDVVEPAAGYAAGWAAPLT